MMNRIQTASYCLIASAFVLSGMLLFQLRGAEPRAEAAMVIARESFTLMTAKTRKNEEALFVLDNRSGRLLVYRLRLSGQAGRLEYAKSVDINEVFGQTRSGGASNNNRGGRGGR